MPGAERVDVPAVDDSELPQEVKTAARLQEDLRAWAEKELLPMRMQQAERVAVRGGDTVARRRRLDGRPRYGRTARRASAAHRSPPRPDRGQLSSHLGWVGTLDPTALPSGYDLELALGPLDSLIGEMRLVRDHKYTLLLKFVARLHQAGRVWPVGELPAARLAFSPLTPTDQAAVLDLVVKAYAAGVISLETAVRMLMDAGFPIDSAATEIDLIQARAFDAAARLADATGDNAAVREYLGLTEDASETGPAPLIPTPPLADAAPVVNPDDDTLE
ncbi:hypothetical protein [Streptomyces cupreus]|uniref:Uncharacterized protein n=1 Tax=Streptomyces cupreus TaxID=2759956 RepID=A0A7X1J5Y2_9ACTN|nr:hypothetical protein [Streptomyces cupreus]MBC2904818.1 hypothetical protein [Streptomyces cupreus]